MPRETNREHQWRRDRQTYRDAAARLREWLGPRAADSPGRVEVPAYLVHCLAGVLEGASYGLEADHPSQRHALQDAVRWINRLPDDK